MRLLFLIIPVLFIFACKPEVNKHSNAQDISAEDKKAIEQTFIKANQQLLQKENDDMDYYAQSHQLSFVRTSSGIRYCVYKPSAKGDSIKAGQSVVLQYTLSLLDGTKCYSSDQDGKKVFMVEQGEIESGIHKGLQYLKRGDKAILLIPSPLAHGLLGDMKKIPPQMPIVYDVVVE
jgi:FKBP-type peptidyl-prolyl cis-trans isomerase FkpA